MSAQLVHVSPNGGAAFSLVGDVYRFLATGEQTGGVYTLVEARVLPGGGPPPHVHRREDEAFFILEGEMTFQIGDEKITAKPGTFLQGPRDIPHTYKNEGRSPVRMLVYVMPPGFENFVKEAAKPLPTFDSAPMPVAAEDIQKLMTIVLKYGIEILPPPK